MTEFVHLHVHTQFSLLDGAVKVKDLVKRTAAAKQRAVAVTDHNAMFGILNLYKAAKEANVQAILGCELGHLPLLAATNEGYRNLMWLASHATALPHDDLLEPAAQSRAQANYLLEKLEGRTKGLIGLTGCMGSPLSQRILYEGEHQGNLLLGQLRERFEPGALYVELQDHGLPEQAPLNEVLHGLSIQHGLKKVATNDVHYPERGDADAHLVLGCIKNQRQLVAARAGHHGSSEMYLKSGEEMAQLFTAPTLATTLEIAERCSGLKLVLDKPMLPAFAVPDGYTTESYFRHLAREGLERRIEENRGGRGVCNAERGVCEQRLAFELDVISKMNFPGYFLIVWDFIRFAKERGIPVGPGRGSGAGSIVAYALRITDIDPIRHGLLFERFLNPDRVSMPDFDIDFCMVRRDEVVAYVRQKYGVESVGQIATFMGLNARSVLKDVGRALGMTPLDAQKIANFVLPSSQTHVATIAESRGAEPKLDAPEYREVVGFAQKLEGLTRHVGVHAAGIVISEGPLWDHVPVFRDDAGNYVTQYAMNEVEAAGLVKFDFLGLKTLTVLEIARRLIGPRVDAWQRAYVACGGVLSSVPEPWRLAYEACGGVPQNGTSEPVDAEGLLDLNHLALDDPKVYELLATGETKGVFQLESSGMQQLFRDMKTDNFGDIVAGVALFRPGPLGSGMCKSYVDRKNKREPIKSFHPLVDEHLQDTYGVVVYQEQVMQVARSLAGYTLARADLLRRAMGKKKPAEMAKERVGFVEGAQKNGVDAQEANRIFDLLDFFSGYGFNRCVIGETRIVEARTGERTTIGELFENQREFKIHALAENGKIRVRAVERVMRNGRKPVFELCTANGNQIVATDNHPFRTLNGWTNLEDLRVGDRVAAPREMSTSARKLWPEYELVALAWLLTEGNTCHPTCLYFFNNDRGVIKDFARAAEMFPHSKARVYARDVNRLEVCVSTGRDTKFGNRSLPGPARSGMFEWAGSLGILGKKATQKKVPEPVFLLCDEQLEVFMGRLWSGDGFISNHNHFAPFYATSSVDMARDVQEILLRLGILSRIYTKSFKYKYKGRVRMMPGYTVTLIGGISTRVFLDKVTPHCVGRRVQIDRLRKHLKKTDDNTGIDTIPIGVRDWIREARVERGISWKGVRRGAGISTSEMSRSVSFVPRSGNEKQGFRRDVIRSVGQILKSKHLMDVASSDIFWDRVVSIKPRGEEETYDLTVETDHNFVANGLFVHNSHSAGYALLSYQTGYLKTHYPAEFLCASLTCDQDKSEKVMRTIADALSMGIRVLPPDINKSDLGFKVETIVVSGETNGLSRETNEHLRETIGGFREGASHETKAIRFGLGAVRGLGEAALAGLLEGRPFQDLFDFASRVDVKKGVLETLVQCGALDSMGSTPVERARLFATVELALKRAKPLAKDAKRGQLNWFSGSSDGGTVATLFDGTSTYADVPAWDQREKLARERKALGFYVSGHPMDRYANARHLLDRLGVISTERCDELADGTMVRLIGMVQGYRVKDEWKISFFELVDRGGQIDAKLRNYEAYNAVITSGEPVLVSGRLKQDEAEEVDATTGVKEIKTTLLVSNVRLLADAVKLEARVAIVTVRAPATLEPLQDVLEKVKGTVPVGLRLVLETGAETMMKLPQRVEVSEAFLAGVERAYGSGALEIR